jgi:hypothetical protein
MFTTFSRSTLDPKPFPVLARTSKRTSLTQNVMQGETPKTIRRYGEVQGSTKLIFGEPTMKIFAFEEIPCTR